MHNLADDISASNVSHFYSDYLGDALSTLSGVRDCLSETNIVDLADLAPAVTSAHRIKGNAAMYGFVELGVKAASVEAMLRKLDHGSDSRYAMLAIKSFVEAIEDARSFEPGMAVPMPFVVPAKPVAPPAPTKVAKPRKSVLLAVACSYVAGLVTSLLADDCDVVLCDDVDEVPRLLREESVSHAVLGEDFGDADVLRSADRSGVSVTMLFPDDEPERIAAALGNGIADFVVGSTNVFGIVSAVRDALSRDVRRVLVVDDDPLVRDILAHALSDDSTRVDLVEDGIAALTYLSERTPDLVVLDRYMPRLDGNTVLYEIRNKINLKSIPVLILTAMVNQGEAASWLSRGAADFIAKPFDPEEVRMRVRGHLDAR